MYVGQSRDIDRRWKEHASGFSGKGVLANAISKHGWKSFSACVLEICGLEMLDATERRWISELGTIHPKGYNLTTGGSAFFFSAATKKKISRKTKGRPKSEEWKAKMRGKKKPLDWCLAMSERQRGAANVARLTELARNQSAETRAKIGSANRGKKRTEDTKALISQIKSTPENRAKASASAKKQFDSPEKREAMAAAMRAGWARRRARLQGESQ